MTTNPPTTDITIRGGVINVPHSTEPTHPKRHQPNTPPTKKRTKARPDHKIPDTDSPTTAAEPPATAAAPPVSPKPEPETASEE